MNPRLIELNRPPGRRRNSRWVDGCKDRLNQPFLPLEVEFGLGYHIRSERTKKNNQERKYCCFHRELNPKQSLCRAVGSDPEERSYYFVFPMLGKDEKGERGVKKRAGRKRKARRKVERVEGWRASGVK